MRKALVFDLDGTLIDSAEDISSVLNAVLNTVCDDPFSASDVRSLMGEGALGLISKALQLRHVPVAAPQLTHLKDKFLELYCDNPVVRTTVFPHALETLSTLAQGGIRLGVCTNKAERAARLILARLGLDHYLHAIVGGDSGFGRKPSPEPLFACASQLGLAASDVVFVGDHQIDIRTARAANVPVIACAFGYSDVPVHTLGADRTIECLSELAHAIAMIGSG